MSVCVLCRSLQLQLFQNRSRMLRLLCGTSDLKDLDSINARLTKCITDDLSVSTALQSNSSRNKLLFRVLRAPIARALC